MAIFVVILFLQMSSRRKSYPRSIAAVIIIPQNVDIHLIYIFHSTTACCIITLSFKIHRCASRYVGYIFICYCVSSKTF